jgi:ribosome recycling factor
MQLIIPLPPMTKQTRLDNQKKVKDLAEKQKTIIQNIRQKYNKQIKAASKDDPTLGEDIVKKLLKDVDKEIQKSFGEVTKIADKVSEDIMAA